MLIFAPTNPLPSLKYIRTGFFLALNICVVFFASGQARQSYVSDPDVKVHFYKGFANLYRFEFQSCKTETELLLSQHPASSWGYILAAEYHWWMIISGDKSLDHGALLVKNLQSAAQRSDALSKQEGLFCKVISYSLRSRYEIFKGNYLKSIELLNQSSGFMKEAVNQSDNYEPFLLTKGLYNYFMAEAGSRFWILNPMSILGIDVSKERGLEYLTQLSHSSDEILSTEASYFLMKIFLELEHNETGAKRFSGKLLQIFPTNLVFRYYDFLEGNIENKLNQEQVRRFRQSVKEAGQLNAAQRLHFEQLIIKNNK
jgi:hypothetical protein